MSTPGVMSAAATAVSPAAHLAPPPGTAEAGTCRAAEAGIRRYGVVIGGQRLLLGADGAVRVLEPPAVFRLPNTRAWFLGIVNVRGTLVPVHDLAAWLGLPVPEGRRMLLVIGDGESSAATLVDTTPRHLILGDDAAGAAGPVTLPETLAAHGSGTFTLAGESWTDLDWTALFNELKTLALVAE